MPNSQLLDCFQTEPGALDRVNYFLGQLLTPSDMTADQDYFRQKLRRHNRFHHGWGVVCGVEVSASPTEGAPWRVQIGGGLALGPYGDEIYVPQTVFLDLAQCGPGATTDPCAPDRLRRPDDSTAGEPIFMAIQYAECVARPVQVMPAGCACDETACEYSRIQDSYQIECLTGLPDSHQPAPPGPSLCDFINKLQLAPCPPCPPDSWVVLAQVDLPALPTTRITDAQINNFVRRQLYSTAVLQEMVIACCCDGADLEITKGFAIQQPFTIIYTISVTNNGGIAAENVIVEDTVTASPRTVEIEMSNFSDQWTTTDPPGPFFAQLGTLQPQETVILTFEVTLIASPGSAATIDNTAIVTSDTPDPNLDNNQASTTTIFEPAG